MIDRGDIKSPAVLAGYDYWLAKQLALGDPAILPARSHLDPPLEIPRLVPHLMLMDVKAEPLDFRYRLIGSALRRHMAEDWTGRYLSDIPFQRSGSMVWENNVRVVTDRDPLLARPPYVGPHKDFLYVESVILPLAGDGRNIDMLMFAVDFITGAAMKRGTPQ